MHDADAESSPSSIEGYLARLEVALHGADPAVAHDALIDAEEHLQAAVRRGVPVGEAIAAYGSVEEIAEAYRSMPGSVVGARLPQDRRLPSAPSLACD